MALFDELISEDEVTKVIDLGDETFEKFFTLLRQLGLVDEARRRGIEVVTLFIADPDPRSAKSYAGARRHVLSAWRWCPSITSRSQAFRTIWSNFPNPVAGERAVRIPVLSPFLKSIVDKPGFSFDDYLERQTDDAHRTARMDRTQLHGIPRTGIAPAAARPEDPR